MTTLLVLIKLLILFKISLCQLQNQIYSQFYVNRYDYQDQDGQAFNIKIASISNNLFVASNQGGVIIFDAKNSKKVAQQTFGSKTLCVTVECSNDGTYFLAGVLPNLIKAYSFQSKTVQITQLYEYKYDEQIQDMIKSGDERFLYVIGTYQMITVVDFQVRDQFKVLAKLSQNNNRIIRKTILVSKSNNYFYVGGGMAGLFVYKYDQQQNQIINLALVPTGYVASACIGTSDNNYMYGTNQYTGLYVADLRPLQGIDSSQYPLSLPIKIVWPFQTIQPLAYSINISQNEDMIYVGVRSQGILVFNITDKLNPQYFYQIQIISLSYYITFSSNYQYLYYANANSVYTFQLIDMNLNDQVPNVFNSQQFVQKNEPSFMKPYCSIFDDNFYFGFFNAHLFSVGNIQGNPYQLDIPSNKVYNIWSASLTQYKGSTIFYVPLIGLSKTNVAFYAYDYSSLYTSSDVTLMLTFSLPDQYVNENIAQLDFNLDQTLCVVAQYSGFYLLKFDGPLKITFLQYYRNQYYQIVGTTKRAVFSKDNQYILISIQNFGLSVIQIQENYKLVQVNDLQTLGAENMMKSDISTDYCFLYDGSNGFAIIDLTALPQIKILSRISLTGWTIFGVSLYNDSYVFVQQNEKGMISVIDIRDKQNISLFSQYERGADQAQSACVSKNYDFSFIQNNNYVLVMPLKSQIMLQSTAREIAIINNTQQFVKAIQKDEILQVGQTVQFYFQILYPKSQQMVIQKINIYQNFQEQTLPTWMIYNQQTQTLTMVLDKTNAGTTSSQINRIILLVYTFCPLSSTSFFYPSGLGITTQDQSKQIYAYLKSQNIIGVQNQLSSDFNPSLDLTINVPGMNTQIINNVKQTLVQSVWINQVVLQTQSSLTFDSFNSIISSRSNAVTVQLNAITGKFVTVSYSGATVQYSINQNELDLTGPLQQINSILAQKIIFYTSNQTDTNQISITINDNLNFPINYQCNAAKCSFIKFKEQISVQQINNLQTQIETKYTDSVIDIETSYSIQFMQSTFKVSDIQTITYTFKYKTNEMEYFVDFDPTFWLQSQSDKQLSFYGNTQYSQLGKIYTIQITAFDGYTSVSDQFHLKVQGIPFSYIFNILLKVIGPLVAILGLYKYRSLLVNSVVVNYFTFSQENINFEAKYFKKIPLIGIKWKKCSILIDNLFLLVQREIQQQNGERAAVKVKSNKKRYHIHQNLIKNKNIFKNLEHSKKDSHLEKRYLNKDGSIKMCQLLEDFNNYKEVLFIKNKKLEEIKKYFGQALQPDSLYYESIKSYACLQLLKLDPKSYFTFLFVKQQLIFEGFSTKNDWYLKIVEIDHRYKEELDHSPFSQVQIKQKELQQIISHLYDYEQNAYQINSNQNIINQGTQINMRLIESCIISEVHGLTFDKLSYFQQFQGEALHLNSQQVSNIQGFKLCEKGILQKVRKICNQEYIPYGVQQNMKFPDWLRLKFKDDYLKLQGTPTSNNEEQILIRIFDLDGYIVKQFMINIQPYLSNTFIMIPEEKQNDHNTNIINQQITASGRLASLQQKLKLQYLPDSKLDSKVVSLYSTPRLLDQQIQPKMFD
ncbi:calpain family cysteine protease (macronuclear) [Tetrahymena thermophila SB210]|uniref:Calpain family cysteine protease n=1 Tax=Tetrahymena thermophila (strain SB210) TaxID=312017 RepID=Q22D86_TETTS|nr:calpain family cysteine protease [Tetrahymena thermophila SB210]EAR83239.1 calpain family cysteine protease [Tetrahymena thermophila SB210]|eukprot:XP_001030902.1 calpain family cysteine protease [Tetrahymena thermophila SB210]